MDRSKGIARRARLQVGRGLATWRSLSQDRPLLYWSQSKHTRTNWGDALNPVLIEAMTGLSPLHAARVFPMGRPVLAAIGSILDAAGRYPSLEIWGSGMKSPSPLARPPRRIHAVRGPLTRKALLAQGLACPEVFGDPALLYPRFFTVRPYARRLQIGFIPHYVDQAPFKALHPLQDGEGVIDILAPIEQVANEVASCDLVVSSSLHGLILADALGVPNTRMRITDKVAGGDFKFHDYSLAVGRPLTPAVDIQAETTVSELHDAAFRGPVDVDLEALLAAFPLPLRPSA